MGIAVRALVSRVQKAVRLTILLLPMDSVEVLLQEVTCFDDGELQLGLELVVDVACEVGKPIGWCGGGVVVEGVIDSHLESLNGDGRSRLESTHHGSAQYLAKYILVWIAYNGFLTFERRYPGVKTRAQMRVRLDPCPCRLHGVQAGNVKELFAAIASSKVLTFGAPTTAERCTAALDADRCELKINKFELMIDKP